jgi:hypothetical protein
MVKSLRQQILEPDCVGSREVLRLPTSVTLSKVLNLPASHMRVILIHGFIKSK